MSTLHGKLESKYSRVYFIVAISHKKERLKKASFLCNLKLLQNMVKGSVM